MFRDRIWKGVYRSDTDNLLEDFYIQALRDAVSYDRAVGFFSASMLSYAAQGVTALVENGGRMRLIFGGELAGEDAAAIEEGYDQRALGQRVGDSILNEIGNLADALSNYRLCALAWLISNGRLDVKVALKRQGMYHEKIGIFTDANGDGLVFQGSANETTRALLPDFNFESINVFPTWRPELADHFQPYVDGFERLWFNQTRDTIVIDFPEAAKEKLIKIAVQTSKPPDPVIEREIWAKLLGKRQPIAETENPPGPMIPRTYKGQSFSVRDHQRDALNAWRSRDFQGIIALATGAGKTVTAIYGLVKLYQRLQKLFVVIAVPYQALADQWVDELALFNIKAIQCYESISLWGDRFSECISLYEAGVLRFCACVVVNRTLECEAFQVRLNRISGETLAFVGDECHSHAAKNLSAALPQHARIRIGLSATPRHYFDEERTRSLIHYYGDIAYEYSLEQALRDGILTPYEYHLHLVDLTERETENYLDLSRKISRLMASGGERDIEEPTNHSLKMLLFKRARLLANAENKIVKLDELVRGTKPSPFHLFYCGDGVCEYGEDGEGGEEGPERQVDQVSQLLYQQGWKVAHFTAQESRTARRAILDNFRIGFVDGLVAIRCLDEGVDIPDCRVAYILASSRNPKQFIQRRGRILRRAFQKEFAVIHDFLVTLPEEAGEGPTRQLLVNELKRVSEFGRLASNWNDVYQVLKPLLVQYDLEHHFV